MRYKFKNNISSTIGISIEEHIKFAKMMNIDFKESSIVFYKLVKIAKKSLNDVVEHKVEALKKAYELVKKLVRIIIGKDPNPFKTFKEKFNRKTKLEKIKYIMGLSVLLGVAMISGGGFDREGGIPDLDLIFGVGMHRNPISHTILGGAITEFIFRFVLYTVEEFNLTTNKKILKLIFKTMDKNKDYFINGMWIGYFFHLFKDASVLHSRIKPYVWTSGHSMTFHKLTFLINALLSGVFALGKSEKNR